MNAPRLALAAVLALAALPAAGCSSVRYSFWEMFGEEKRDLLKSALKGLVGDQNEAKENFGTALDRVKALTHFQGGDLESEYDKLKAANDDAVSSAKAIDARVSEIEEVASDLFDEWAKEIGQMQTPSLRQDSERKLADTRARYDTMHASMLASRRSMDPALTLLNDQVLYLKHNLNAAAIGSLGQSMADVEKSIVELRARIEASIREAQGFIDTMQ
jgi:uncharacterized phage infection (PIP) family protein YhgE